MIPPLRLSAARFRVGAETSTGKRYPRLTAIFYIDTTLPCAQNFNIEVLPRSIVAAPVRTVPLAEKLSDLLRRRSEHRLTCTCCRKLIQLVNRKRDEKELPEKEGTVICRNVSSTPIFFLFFFFRNRSCIFYINVSLWNANLLAVDWCRYRSTTSITRIDLSLIFIYQSNVKFINTF